MGWGGEEKFKIKAKLSPAEAWAELGNKTKLQPNLVEVELLLSLALSYFTVSNQQKHPIYQLQSK